jgi:hypothetical protein
MYPNGKARRKMLKGGCAIDANAVLCYGHSRMTIASEQADNAVNANTLRVRRHRERRRNRHALLTVEVPQSVIDATIERGLLEPGGCAEAWVLIQACYASMLSDAALNWLIRNGIIRSEQRGNAGAILRNISRWLEHSA